MLNKKVIIISAVAIATIGLCIFIFIPRAGGPPRRSQRSNLPAMPNGIVAMPVYIPVSDIERIIRSEISSPAVSGVTPELDGKLLAVESISFEEMVKEQVSPFIPGHFVEGVREELVAVRESFSCLINPFKWGSCWRDVLKPVLVPFRQWVEPQLAVYRFVSKPATKFLDKVYDVGAWIHYDIFVKDLTVEISGNKVTVHVSTLTKLKLDYKQPIIPLGPTITIKGALNCDVENKLTIAGQINLTDKLGLEINLNEDDTKLDFTKICAPLAVEGIDFLSYLNPQWLGYKKALGALVKKSINNAIKKKLDNEGAGGELADQLKVNAEKFNQARMLDKDLWLIPNIKECIISNPESYTLGNENYLHINVGLKGNPSFVYSADTPSTNISELKLSRAAFEPKVNATLEVALDYVTAGKQLTDTLNQYVKKELSKYTVTSNEVTIYPSDAKLVVAIDFTFMGKKRKSKVYLWGIPKFNGTDNSFLVDSLDYHLKSKNVLLKGADKLFWKKVIDFLKVKSKWSVDSPMRSIAAKLKSIESISEFGILSGSLDQPGISGIYTKDDRLSVFVNLTGSMSFKLQSQHFIALEGQQSTVTNELPFAITPENITTLPIFKVGDSTFRKINGEVSVDLITFKQKSLAGDTVFYKDESGRIQFHILTSTDLKKEEVSFFGSR